ncbi:MAG: 50S ribosomal protein L17 [Candidatus Omnitrophica bacterium]|nr:50S ribosomal protein L17 [Candidatus Omnitrophota bacterium]
MRHQKLKRKLGVKSQHRRALLRNLVKSLIQRKRIRTTLARAKEASAFADSMVTIAKKGDLHAHRLLVSKLACKESAKVLMAEIAPLFKDRKGGYTRVLRMVNRPGDNSKMALLEFTEIVEAPKKDTKKKAKKDSKKSDVKSASESVKTETPKTKKAVKSDAETKNADAPDAKESEKRGGFLGSLRKFLKGDE